MKTPMTLVTLLCAGMVVPVVLAQNAGTQLSRGEQEFRGYLRTVAYDYVNLADNYRPDEQVVSGRKAGTFSTSQTNYWCAKHGTIAAGIANKLAATNGTYAAVAKLADTQGASYYRPALEAAQKALAPLVTNFHIGADDAERTAVGNTTPSAAGGGVWTEEKNATNQGSDPNRATAVTTVTQLHTAAVLAMCKLRAATLLVSRGFGRKYANDAAEKVAGIPAEEAKLIKRAYYNAPDCK